MSFKSIFEKYDVYKECPHCKNKSLIELEEGLFVCDNCGKEYKGSLEESVLNEGPGAGYEISGDGQITSIDNIEIVSDVITNNYNNAFVKFTCDANGFVRNLVAESYYYFGEIEQEVPIKAHTGIHYLDKAEDANDTEKLKAAIKEDALNDKFSFEFVYGGGWTHSTWDGSISDDKNLLEIGSYADTQLLDACVVDEEAINYIDAAVRGHNQVNQFIVYKDGEDIDAFEDFDEAVDFAKANDADKIKSFSYVQSFDGDLVDQGWSETVWEKDVDESLKEARASRYFSPVFSNPKEYVKKCLKGEVKSPYFRYLSNNGESGEVELDGTTYAFRKLPNGDYKVMTSQEAGWNWSETLFKDESLKESWSDASYKDYESINKFVRENNGPGFIELVNCEDGPLDTSIITVEIEGDWKHDHDRFDYLVEQWAEKNDRKIIKIDVEVIEDTEEDWYPAQHTIYIAKDDESYDTLNKMRPLFANESLSEDTVAEGIDIESTGVNRMPLYQARPAINKFKEDAKKYPYWVIKTDRWYDPEGLDIPSKDYNIQFAGTQEECRNKIVSIQKEAENNKYGNMEIESQGEDFIQIYYPRAIAKAVFSVIKNPIVANESLSEDTIKQDGKWVNKGKEGTHGKFKTKKAADAQRKAMFANGYKEELKESVDYDYEDFDVSDLTYPNIQLDDVPEGTLVDDLDDVDLTEFSPLVDELNGKITDTEDKYLDFISQSARVLTDGEKFIYNDWYDEILFDSADDFLKWLDYDIIRSSNLSPVEEDFVDDIYKDSKEKEKVEESLITPSEEDIAEFEAILAKHNFSIDNKGQTLMRRVHYQIRDNSGAHIDLSDRQALRDFLDPLIDDIQKFEDENEIPITWNFGLDKNGIITGGLDLDKKWVDDKQVKEDINMDDRTKENIKDFVNYYKKIRGLDDSFELTKDTVDEWAFKQACIHLGWNYDSARAIILKEEWEPYED